jgi:hypothetical protein
MMLLRGLPHALLAGQLASLFTPVRVLVHSSLRACPPSVAGHATRASWALRRLTCMRRCQDFYVGSRTLFVRSRARCAILAPLLTLCCVSISIYFSILCKNNAAIIMNSRKASYASVMVSSMCCRRFASTVASHARTVLCSSPHLLFMLLLRHAFYVLVT